MEYCKGGELFDRIQESGYYREHSASMRVRSINDSRKKNITTTTKTMLIFAVSRNVARDTLFTQTAYCA